MSAANAQESATNTAGFNWPLLALAIGAFGIGTTEFAPMGLLPVIADGVDVSTTEQLRPQSSKRTVRQKTR